jgi:hypothetical protein
MDIREARAAIGEVVVVEEDNVVEPAAHEPGGTRTGMEVEVFGQSGSQPVRMPSRLARVVRRQEQGGS